MDRQLGLGTQKVTLRNLGLMWKILCHSRFVKGVHERTFWLDM